MNEATTRSTLIDPALARAGWHLHDPAQVRFEIPVDGFDPGAWAQLRAQLDQLRETGAGYTGDLPAGICDYALYRANGEIIAVVEAKKTAVDPRLAQAQAEFYVTQIARRQSFPPFAFMSNGREIYFLEAGQAHKRLVAGFFAPADLDNLLWLRQHGTPLSRARINPAITDRPYQQEAVRRVCEAFAQNRRRTLLIMATGTGKTRTVMSIVDLFLRTNQARHILFVADRDPLVEQALTDGFKRHLPHEPHARIFTGKIATDKRLYVSTLQTLSICYQQFTPAFFDLIIFDEVHRSIFNQWSEVLQYFDARMIGLTATPAAFVDRNTFLAFDCPDGIPTFLYDYKEAVREGYLVDFSLYRATTGFQRRGIHGVDLSDEQRNTLIQQGLDPDAIDYAGTDLEKSVTNRDTLRKQWQEILDKCLRDEGGQLPGKTIVFAMTQDHALRLLDVFEEMFPQWVGLARVITSASDYRHTLIAPFKKEDRPRIAITVDLLETGIDVPEVVNLVFMKPVQSRIKLWQMIGRGTRNQAACTHREWLPQGQKREFLILDFWENDFEREATEDTAPQDLPVLVTLFNTRLKLLALYLARPADPQRARLIAALRAQIASIPTVAFSVKRVLPEIELAWQDPFWQHLTAAKLDFLRNKVGPLLRYVPAVDVQAETFASKVERLKLQTLTGKDARASAESIAEDVSRLPEFVVADPQRKPLVELCLSPGLQVAAPAELDPVIDGLAGQMKYRREKQSAFLTLDLPDFIAQGGFILLHGGADPVYVAEYRQRVNERILALVDSDSTLQAIGRGETVGDRALVELERTLRHVLGSGSLELSESNVRMAYGWRVGSLIEFVRRLLDLHTIPDYAEIVRREFEAFVSAHHFNANQIKFLRAVQHVFVDRRRVALADLYEAPFTAFGQDAVERWFSSAQVKEILALTAALAA